MLNLFFKKNFYDGWDNVMYFFVPNLIIDFLIIISSALCIPGVTIFKESQWYLYVWFAAIILFSASAGVVTVTWSETAAGIADYDTVDIKKFFKDNLKNILLQINKFKSKADQYLFTVNFQISPDSKSLLFDLVWNLPNSSFFYYDQLKVFML